jgi:hypothetical protein
MNPSLIRNAVATLPSDMSQPGATANRAEASLEASLLCLALLIDAMRLVYHTPGEGNSAPTQSDALLSASNQDEIWKTLFDQLSAWYTARPPELQTLIDMERHDADFPTVRFTSGVGVWANTMYHTTMTVLLSHPLRPQLVSKWLQDTLADKRQTSSLWHARRVCGIAVHSDPELTRCWDPCMIAAFSVTAKRMTHPAQHSALLVCLNRVKMLGWHIDSLIESLQQEWGIA